MQQPRGAKALEGFGLFMMLVMILLGCGIVYYAVMEFSVAFRFPQPVTVPYEEFVARHPRDGWFRITGAATNLNEAAWEENIGTGRVTRVFLPLHSLRNPFVGQIRVLLETKDPSILEFMEQRKNQKSSASVPGMGFSPMQPNFGPSAPSLEGTVSISGQAPVMASRFKAAHVQLPGGLDPDFIYFTSGSSPSMGKAAAVFALGVSLIGFIGFAVYKIIQEKKSRII